MSRICVIDAERRNWNRRLKKAEKTGDDPVITRRYLVIVEDAKFREIIRREFSTYPNAVYPHESRKDDLFYCIAGPSSRRTKRFLTSLRYKLRKNKVTEDELAELDIVAA